MSEANDLNAWFNCAAEWCKRLHFRTASFCTERSGHFDAFDQGISFFLPNMTWLQPPGYVHKMIADTWASKGLNVSVSTEVPATGKGPQSPSASAQLSDDGKTVYVRVAVDTATTVVLQFNGKPLSGVVKRTTISALNKDAANSPGDPTFISPVASTVDLQNDGSVAVPSNSFTVFECPVPAQAESLLV